MLLIRCSVLMLVLVARLPPYQALSLQHTSGEEMPRYNASYETPNPSGLASIFSPRMDFEQWKPLTGRGDPLRNDPTYDYEPPVLKRVHYWADDTRLEREHYPEKKSEVLMLGVSSRKPSVTSRQPPLPPKRQQQYSPLPPKYEDYTYKLSDVYPLTILVPPPPPPPPGHQPSLYALHQEKLPLPSTHLKVTDAPQLALKDITTPHEKLTSSFALQEANLIYQSSSTVQNWIRDVDQSISPNLNNVVSSDYAGWGPTTPLNEYDPSNETHNLISNDYIKPSKHPYSFYRPMLSEAPPPPVNSLIPLPSFLPTPLPSTAEVVEATESISEVTWPTEPTTFETTTKMQDYYDDTTTEKTTTVVFPPTKITREPIQKLNTETNLFNMLGPMMSMPIVNGPDRPEDNLYAHATENMQIFVENNPEDILKLENMQTMQPPPPVQHTESTTISHKQPYHANSNTVDTSMHIKPSLHTHDPYLHMRFTTPIPSTTSIDPSDINKYPTEDPVPKYLIIQGHSKVKTYGSKSNSGDDKHTLDNEIPKPNETNEVKHLHPIKEKFAKKMNFTEDINQKSRAKSLKALIDNGHGSIEIQEADVGIKYDVSDGSDVPIELYRKGIVDSDENDYKTRTIKESEKLKRIKRQIDFGLSDLFDEDAIENLVFNFLESKKNETGLTGLLAQAVASEEAGAAVDEIEDDFDTMTDDDNDQESEEDR